MVKSLNGLLVLGSLLKSRKGRIVLVALLPLIAWTVVEAVTLSGEMVYNDYLAYNKPLALEATTEGERFRVQISSSKRGLKRSLSYKVIGTDGTALVNDSDTFSRANRAFYFTAEKPGRHRLIIDEEYSPGGQAAGRHSKYLNSKWVRVYRDDNTLVLGLLGQVTSW